VQSVLTKQEEIIALARSPSPEDRELLLSSITDLCERDGGACLKPEVQALLQEIFMGLVTQAERDIRQRLAERLSSATWAPPALICVLALDDIDIARPIITKSPILQDHDLIRLLVEATLEHQIEVARRPSIGPTVVNAILDQSQPAVLIALSGNETADISPFAMQRLVIASQRIAALRGSLAQHPRLTREMAESLYSWVGEAVRESVASRFKLDPPALADKVSEAVADAVTEPAVQSQADAVREREEMERQLIAKLNAADQLRPGYILRALREGRLVRFEAALVALGGYSGRDIRHALNSGRPELLALACVGVGIDRSVFPTILSLVRALNGGRPAASTESTRKTNEAFALSQNRAAKAFQDEIATV
jgi:uncharacterized protein (DUF2336 family)